MGDLSIGTLMQISAWGLGAGTFFFAFTGIRFNKDFYLTMGLVACTLGDLAFAAFLNENNDDATRKNDTFVAAFIALAFLSVYALFVQLWKFKEEGFGFEEDEEEEEEPKPNEATPSAPAVEAQPVAPAAIENKNNTELRRRT
jgi:hypothetical protein